MPIQLPIRQCPQCCIGDDLAWRPILHGPSHHEELECRGRHEMCWETICENACAKTRQLQKTMLRLGLQLGVSQSRSVQFPQGKFSGARGPESPNPARSSEPHVHRGQYVSPICAAVCDTNRMNFLLLLRERNTDTVLTVIVGNYCWLPIKFKFVKLATVQPLK